jgi:HAD superfamily hydrolase (TIGR01509 family)
LFDRVPPTAVLLDVDGTLVDSNDAHAHAWVGAFSEAGIDVRFDDVRRCIGMGADKLMPAVSALKADDDVGKKIAARRGEIFRREWLPGLRPHRDAERLLHVLKERGLRLVTASSAKREELRPLLRVVASEWVIDAHTSSDDADASKPEPDIIVAALKRARVAAAEAVMLGDTPYDVEAAMRAGVRIVAFRCGGWGDRDLRGAAAVYDGPWDLLAGLDSSPLAGV